MNPDKPIAALNIKENSSKSLYPEPYASMMSGRTKRKLGDYFGLENIGVNLTELAPGGMSALKHHHLKQDEFIYILSGTPTLIYGDNEYPMSPGDCFGFRKGSKMGHHLLNRSATPVMYLETGDRTAGDVADYPDDDICASSNEDGKWVFTHKDGKPY